MKKNLLLSFCVLSGLSYGQFYLSGNEPVIGNTRTMYSLDTAATDYATVIGNGVTWDYSQTFKVADPAQVEKTVDYVANSDMTTFPNATKQRNTEGVLTSFLSSTPSARYMEGFVYVDPGLGTVTANFTADNILFMNHPFALNDVITDVFSGTLNVPPLLNNAASSGTAISKFDGNGTLMLANGITRTNVQRHHFSLNLSANTLFGPATIDINQYEYTDFVGSDMPVFSHTNIEISTPVAGVVTSLNFVLSAIEPLSSVGLNEKTGNANFSIYPNPATDELILSGELNGNEKFSLTDLSGKIIPVNVLENKVNVANLESGVYFLGIEKDGIYTSKKFVKK